MFVRTLSHLTKSIMMHFFIDLNTTVFADCSTGEVRLADLILNGSTARGRVEVCINQAWGTVCNTRFDEEDAGTVCVVAGGYFRNGAWLVVIISNWLISYPICHKIASSVISTQMTGQGPIFLEQLDCTPADTDLLSCSSLSAQGVHSCTHSQDVYVECTGTYVRTYLREN